MRRHRYRFHRHNKFHRKNHSQKNFSSKRTFFKTNNFIKRHPIFSALASIIISIILIRISFLEQLFGKNLTEFRLWFLFFAVLLGIIGIIAIKVWFRNNVSNFTTRHTVDWRNR